MTFSHFYPNFLRLKWKTPILHLIRLDSLFIDMNKRNLEKLSKAELIKMAKKLQKKAKKPKIVIVDDDYRPVLPPRTYKPIPAPSANETIKKPVPKPSTSVKQMVNEHEDLILPPPPQFRDGYKPVPAPRTDKSQKQPRRLSPGGPKAGHFISRRQSELIVQENQKAQKPIRRPPQRPPPPPPRQRKYDYPFNFDDDIFQTENESIGKFKIVSTRSVQNKKFISFTNEFNVKIFKKIGRC